MYPVSTIWQDDDRLGECLITGLEDLGSEIFNNGSLQVDLTQTSFSSIPSVDIELGNATSDCSEEVLMQRAQGILRGVNMLFGR